MSPPALCIKAVTFDLWETLLFEKDGANARRTLARCRNLAQTLKSLGIETSSNQIALALDRTINSLLDMWDRNEDISHHDQLHLVAKNVLGDTTALKEDWIDTLSSAYVSPLFEVSPFLNPDSCGILRWLRKRGKRIGLICNTGLTPGFGLKRFLSEQGVSRYFDILTFSDEVGVRKPDLRIFHLAAQALKARPCEIIHIGDNLKSDVWGAKNAGFRAIHFACDKGRDKIAESDPKSLVSRSRNLGNLNRKQISPDKTVTTLKMAVEAIKELETGA